MLTKDLLDYRIRKGRIRPAFVDPDDPDLLALSRRMLELARASVGVERKTVEDALRVEVASAKRPKVARGLVKLVLDRMDFGEAGEEAYELRRSTLGRASEILRGLPEGAAFEAYEVALAEVFGDLEPIRERLYADLAEYRPLLSFDGPEPKGLLDRYNLAQAQGLMFFADRMTVTLEEPDLLELRRLLRWLKFCRLVAEVTRVEGEWRLVVEGPGNILSMQKKYGLQLASFLAAIPLLSDFTVTAEIRPPRKASAALKLTHEDPLVSHHRGAPGHVPEEIEQFVEGLRDEGWSIDTTPEVRNVGVSDVAVPDFILRRGKEEEVAVELFHRWHRGQLLRRLDALASKPDPRLVLGVDRSLLDDTVTERIEGNDQVFLFKSFPSRRALRRVLKRFDERL